MTPKQKFIFEYLNKKMRKSKLPYGMAWFNLLANTEEEAELKWKKRNKLLKL